MIKAEIVAHSLSPEGDELITVLATFPRMILAEVNTHRMLSKNTSSSRAIPFEKMVKAIEENPFIPIGWQKDHKGMQGTEYFADTEQIEKRNESWLQASRQAILMAKVMNSSQGVTKQLCNRLLEPWMWTTMLITGSREGWDNFFSLRCPQYDLGNGELHRSKKDALDYAKNTLNLETLDGLFINDIDWLKANKGHAEIHMMALAESIWDALNDSTPKQLEAGQWHIPFEDRIHDPLIWKLLYDLFGKDRFEKETDNPVPQSEFAKAYWETKVKIAVSMAARTSYTIVGNEKKVDYKKLVDLYDRLIQQDPPHSSPFEHVAKAMGKEEYYRFAKGILGPENHYKFRDLADKSKWGWCYNIKGFISQRYMIDNKMIIF